MARSCFKFSTVLISTLVGIVFHCCESSAASSKEVGNSVQIGGVFDGIVAEGWYLNPVFWFPESMRRCGRGRRAAYPPTDFTFPVPWDPNLWSQFNSHKLRSLVWATTAATALSVCSCFIARGLDTVVPAHSTFRRWGTSTYGIKGFVIATKSFVKIGITKIFCYNNKMFSSIDKAFRCCSKIFGCRNKKLFVVPNIIAVTKPFFPCWWVCFFWATSFSPVFIFSIFSSFPEFIQRIKIYFLKKY